MIQLARSKLSYKIFLTTASALCGLLILSSWVVYSITYSIITSHLKENLYKTVSSVRQIVETSASLSVRNYLRGIAEEYVQRAGDFHQKSLDGILTKQDAQESMRQFILSKPIGTSGYLYVLGSDGIVKIHPQYEMLGRNVSDQSFIQEQINKKQGFVEYEWQNPGDASKKQKVLYMEYFEPWDWIVSVSAYREELPQLVLPSDFKEVVLSIKINENGYPFVLKTNGDMLAHPTIQGNVVKDKLPNKEFFIKLIEMANGQLFYKWTDPIDGSVKEKIIVFETIKDYGWLVASTGYVNDFYAPLHLLKKIFIALFFLGLFISFAISYHLSRLVTSPLNKLINELSENSKEIGPFKANFSNEIQAISSFCSEHIHELKSKNDQLTKLNADQKQSALNLSIFKEVFENVVEGISITDSNGIIILANPAFALITGYSIEEAIGNNPKILKSNRHPPIFYEKMWSKIKKDGYWSGEIWNKRKNGDIYPEWLTITAIHDNKKEVSHYAAVFNDISKIVEQQEEIQFLAYHDHLTDLPNRILVLQRLKQMISECARQGGEVFCLAIDLDNFKTFNDSMGQDNGDILIRKFVDRVKPMLREEDTFGRIGGDDFVISVILQSREQTAPLKIVNRLFECIDEPFNIAGHKIHLILHIGISVFPKDAENADIIFKNANIALQSAKTSNSNSYSFFNSEMESSINKKLHYLEKIRDGIKGDEFIPFFQPKVDLKTGKVKGMEALARWKSNDLLVNPGDFIPIAEESGLIVPISKQIYQKAFKETLRLHKMGHFLSVSVNLSPAQFQDEYFVENLISLHKASGLEAKYIELEITESILFDNTGPTGDILETISSLGFSISIDDFGTGYSSLQYLKQLPLNTLKIDMSFVSGIGIDQNDENLVQTIVLLAKQFDLSIVAEGIERENQVRFLKKIGCEDGQGFFYGRPMSAADFTEWLDAR